MKRKLFICVFVLLCTAYSFAHAEQDGIYTYQINADNTVTITGFDWNNNHGDIYIPEMLGNRIVTAIGEKAFSTTRNTAVKITLPEGIKSIGEQAFRGVDITYVNIPLSTTEIGGGAFAECSVSRFNVASGHTVFATIDNALYNKQTKTLIAWPENKEISKIPDGILEIGDYAFYGRVFPRNSYGSSIDYMLPESVQYIGKYAFSEIPKVSVDSYIKLHLNKVSIIDDYAFYNSYFNIEDETLYLTKIGAHAFENCHIKIQHIINDGEMLGWYNKLVPLSKTKYEVDDYAFYNCKIEEDVILSLENISSIGEAAFGKFRSLAFNLQYDSIPLDVYYIGPHAFEQSNIYQVNNSASIILPNDNLNKISEYAFCNTGITYVKLNPSCEMIASNAFMNCASLRRVILSNNLLTIENEAFSGCKNLTDVNIPASVIMIGNDVFKDCSSNLIITVEPGSYGEVWARTCGYSYKVNGIVEDTSWLN